MDLIITQAFKDYQPGQRITDPATVKALMASNPRQVVKVASESAPVKNDAPAAADKAASE